MAYGPINNRLQSLAKADGTYKGYTYDANGNMLQAGDNVVSWTSFNQPLEIHNSKTNTDAAFVYDGNQQRIQQITGTDGRSESTTYVSKAFEVTHNDVGVSDRVTQYKHYIYAGDEVVAIQLRTLKDGAKTPDETRYLHKDALGNVDTITDSHGAVIQRISYDPFGNRSVTSSADPDRKAWTSRGFTGHEHLDGLGLIHMNARLYDPEVGRFLSPDSYIQAPEMSQSYNRYIYVMNNPLKYTDPSGHFFDALFDLIGNVLWFVFEHLDIAVMVAAQAMFGIPIGLPSIAIRGAAAGFISTLVHTNSFSAALRNGIWGGAGAAVAGFVGHGGAFGFEWGASPFGGGLGPWLAHGISQGVITQLRGGQFKSGFVGGVIAKAAGAVMGRMGGDSPAVVAARTVTAAVFGGLAAEATGGSFADGALAAAMVHLFNDENFFSPKEKIYQGASLFGASRRGDGVFDVFAHGAPRGVYVSGVAKDGTITFTVLSVDDMAKIIQLHPEYRAGMPVKLWACNVANGDYPQELANILNAPVIAADAYTYYPFDGGTPDVYTSFDSVYGHRVAGWLGLDDHAKWGDDWYEVGGGSGSWVTFLPN